MSEKKQEVNFATALENALRMPVKELKKEIAKIKEQVIPVKEFDNIIKEVSETNEKVKTQLNSFVVDLNKHNNRLSQLEGKSKLVEEINKLYPQIYAEIKDCALFATNQTATNKQLNQEIEDLRNKIGELFYKDMQIDIKVKKFLNDNVAAYDKVSFELKEVEENFLKELKKSISDCSTNKQKLFQLESNLSPLPSKHTDLDRKIEQFRKDLKEEINKSKESQRAEFDQIENNFNDIAQIMEDFDKTITKRTEQIQYEASKKEYNSDKINRSLDLLERKIDKAFEMIKKLKLDAGIE
ncbi:MAG: hypothetical protein ACFFG0_19190 [Candidatus Thorarchaeota archaeon]